MSTTKKIFFISLAILFLSLLLWGVYNLSFKSSPQAPAKTANPRASATNTAPVKRSSKNLRHH